MPDELETNRHEGQPLLLAQQKSPPKFEQSVGL